MDFLKRIADLADFVILRALPVICGFMLVLMVVFIAYTVVMRTVFLNPPFWGDTLALFANVWMVFLGLIIAVRERSNIAMEALYQMIPARYGRLFRKLWALVFAGFVGKGGLDFGSDRHLPESPRNPVSFFSFAL